MKTTYPSPWMILRDTTHMVQPEIAIDPPSLWKHRATIFHTEMVKMITSSYPSNKGNAQGPTKQTARVSQKPMRDQKRDCEMRSKYNVLFQYCMKYSIFSRKMMLYKNQLSLKLLKGHLTIPKRAQRIAIGTNLPLFCYTRITETMFIRFETPMTSIKWY